MMKILLPLLMLFSMSSFAALVTEPSYAAPDYPESDSVVINAGSLQRPIVAETEPFERMHAVTGAATQYQESKTAGISPLSLKPELNEVGWRSTQTI